MQKKILKKTFPIQYLYPNNTDVFQFVEDYYTIFEGQIDDTKICFYNRSQSIIKKTTTGGKNYDETVEFENPSFFVALDTTFDEISCQIVNDKDGLLEWIE